MTRIHASIDRLKALQTSFFKQADIIGNGKALVLVVVVKDFEGSGAPSAALPPIGSDDEVCHGAAFRNSKAETVRFGSI